MFLADSGLLAWLPLAAFWVGLLVMVLCEARRPLHLRPIEGEGRLTANFGLGGVNFLAFALLPLSSVTGAVWAEANGVGALNQLALPLWLVFAATIALRSLAAYGLHVLAHKLPLLWRIHQIHHCDTAIDLSTGFRHHPAELIFVAGCHVALTITFGLSPLALTLYEGVAVLLSLWSHANLRLPERVDRALGLLVVTPALHHVHHSSCQQETDSNYGELFSVWDRVFGTFRRLALSELRTMRPGLGADHDVAAPRLVTQLMLPLKNHSSRAA